MNIFQRILSTYENRRMPIANFGVSFNAHIGRVAGTREHIKYAIYAEKIGELESTVYAVARNKARPTQRILDEMGARIVVDEYIEEL